MVQKMVGANFTGVEQPPLRRIVRLGRRQLLAFGAAVVTALAIAGGAYWWFTGRFIVTTDNAYVRADVVTISPRIAGYIADVLVQDNQTVNKGDVLALVDASTFAARAAQARAAVEAAQADIGIAEAAIVTLDAQVAQQKNLVEQARAQVEASQADLSRSSLELQRQQTLVQRQVSTAQRLEATEADQKKTAAVLAETNAGVGAQAEHLAMLVADRKGKAAMLQKTQAALKQRQAEADLAAVDLANTEIRSPSDGIVGQRAVRTGQYAEPGQPLLAIVPTRTIHIVANFKETQLDGLKVGQPVDIAVDALDGPNLRGRIESFSPASGAQFALLPPDNATGNFTKIVQRVPVRIALDLSQPEAARLKPGMSVITRIDTKPDSEVSNGK